MFAFLGRLFRRILWVGLAGAVVYAGLFFYANRLSVNTNTEGWRMGTVDPYSTKGIPVTGEGLLQMGKGSQTWIVEGVQQNPWAFSSTEKLRNDNSAQIGKQVLMHYRTLRYAPLLIGETAHHVDEIVPLDDKTTTTPAACSVNRASGIKSDGDRVGYLVDVSTEGNIAKTYEIIMQIGPTFAEMSILDKPIFDCAMNFLKSGKKVRVTYTQSYSFMRNPFTRNTDFTIIGIAPFDGQ